VNEWKQKAENDLRTAEIVLSSEEPPVPWWFYWVFNRRGGKSSWNG